MGLSIKYVNGIGCTFLYGQIFKQVIWSMLNMIRSRSKYLRRVASEHRIRKWKSNGCAAYEADDTRFMLHTKERGSMMRLSLDAIRTQLKAIAPSIPIYVKPVASGFRKPAFYARLMEGTYEETHRTDYRMQANWELIYYPKEDEAGQADPIDMLEIADRMHQHFMALPILKGPGGIEFERTSLRGIIRSGEFVLQLVLDVELEQAKDIFDVMKELYIEQ
jgi:hypothetical protein